MLDWLKDIFFGPDYKSIIEKKDTEIWNLNKKIYAYECEIKELIDKLNCYREERFYHNSLLIEENKKLMQELQVIKQADKTYLEALCLKENIELKKKVKELEDMIQSTKDYYKDITN